MSAGFDAVLKKSHHGCIYTLLASYIGQDFCVNHLFFGFTFALQHGVKDNPPQVREPRWPVPLDRFAFRPVHFVAATGMEFWSFWSIEGKKLTSSSLFSDT